MPDFDQAQSPRLGQKTPVEATFVRMFTGTDIPEAAWAGQMIYRTDRQVLQVYTVAGAWEDVLGGVGNMLTFVGPSVPTSVHSGDVWYDTGHHYSLYIARSAGASTITTGNWELAQDSYSASQTAATALANAATALANAATAQATADGKVTSYFQGTAPTGLTAGDVGDMWFNTSDANKMYQWSGSSWVLSADTRIGAAVSAAATAQATADGKIVTFYQTTAPTAVSIGDLWVDTSNNNKLYRATSTGTGSWVTVQDGTIAVAQTTADSKVKTFVQSTPPTSVSIGDVWYDTSNFFKAYRAASVGATTIATGQWASVQDGYIGLAQVTANGKIKTFVQGTVPTSVSIGDVWFDSSNGNKQYRAAVIGATTIASGQWVAVQDAAINTAQTTADGKNTVYYASTAPTGGVYKLNDIWFNTGLDWQVSQWNGTAWTAFSFGTTAITDSAISTSKIQVGAVVAEHIDVGAVTADKLSSVLALLTTIQVGDNLFIDSTGITILNPDTTKQPTIIGADGNVFIQGKANLDEVQINNNLTLLGTSNVINGGAKLGNGFAEPTKQPTVSQSFKRVDVASAYGFSRHGLWDDGAGGWLTSDTVSGGGTLQGYVRGGGFGVALLATSQYDISGGCIRQSSEYYLLGKDLADSGNWRIRHYNSSFTLIQSWRINGFAGNQNAAIGWDFVNSIILVFRVNTSGSAIVERWNTNGTSFGADLAIATWDVIPTGVMLSSANGMFGAARYVLTSRTGGTRVYSTATTPVRQTAEEWSHPSGTTVGTWFDGTRFFDFDGRYSSEYATEPGGSYDFSLAWVDNDTAGLGTAISSLSTRKTVAISRFKQTSVSVPSPPDDGTTDGANTVAVYVGTAAGTMYQQTVFATSPTVGGTPTSLSVTYDQVRASTTTAHSGTSGFAGRPSQAPGSIFSETQVSGNPALYFAGNGQFRISGTNLDDVTWTALSGSSVTGFGVQYTVKNGMVILQVDGGISITSSITATTLATGTIPSNLRPPTVTARGGAYFSGQAGVISVATSGTVSAVQVSGSTTSSIGGTLTWPKP